MQQFPLRCFAIAQLIRYNQFCGINLLFMKSIKSNLLGFTTILLIVSCGKKDPAQHPVKRDLAEMVYASGNLYPLNEYKVFSNVTGFLQDVMVTEGDSVSPGTALFVVSGPNRKSETEATSKALQIAEFNLSTNSPVLQQVIQRFQSARAKAQNDSIQLIRYQGLVNSGAVSQAEFDRVRLQAETSSREAKALDEQLNAQRKTLQLELVNAQNRYTQSLNNLGDGLIKSALAGAVFEIYKKPGDYVHQNEALALIGTHSNPVARLSIDEADLNRVKPGQKVFIQLDALPGKSLEATVSRIYPKLNRTEQSFRVDATFDAPLPVNIYGLNLEANILIREAKSILCIPRENLLPGDSVNISRDGKAMKVKVQPGLVDLSLVEIKSGLLETDELINP